MKYIIRYKVLLFTVSLFLLGFQNYIILNKAFQKIPELNVLSGFDNILYHVYFYAKIQTQIAIFPIVLFFASFLSNSIYKKTLLLFPTVVLIVDFFLNYIIDILSENMSNSSALYKTIVNSPQASILVLIIPLCFYSLYLIYFKRKRIFWFSFLTMLAFFSMNLIYHVGLIQGTMKDTVNYIQKQQSKLVKESNNGNNTTYLNLICEHEGWRCITFEHKENTEFNFNEIQNQLIGYVGNNSINTFKNSLPILVNTQQQSENFYFGRNFAISDDDTAYVADVFIEYNKNNKIYNGVIIIDAKYFKETFFIADLYLSKMLIAGNLFWIIMILLLIKHHENMLNRKLNTQ